MAMLINYDRNPNQFSADTTAMLLAVTFSSDSEYKYSYSIIKDALIKIDKIIMTQNLNERKQMCKTIKDSLKAQWGLYLKDGTLPTSPFLKDIVNLAISKEYKANIMASIVRWPEFYLHTENYMNNITKNLDQHLDMINSITYVDKDGNKICPYDPEIGIIEDISIDSVWETMKLQLDSCKEYLHANGEKLEISVEDIKESYYKLKRQRVIIPGSFEEGLVRDIFYVRGEIGLIADKMRRIAEGDILSTELTLSESVSVIKDENIISLLKRIGWKANSIPQVLANIFSLSYPTVNLEKYEGQIVLNMNGEFFDPALGLGPAYKLRVVFNTHNQANNFLEPLAKLIKRSHELNDECEDYLNQCGVLYSDLSNITDVIDLDATGYSDYLSRTIYLLVMDLYNIPKDIQDKVMKIFAFPIKINGKLYYPKFGTEQGCKLVVFLMNTANRLLGYLSRDIYRTKTGICLSGKRANVGDDVEDHITSGIFDEYYLSIQISVFTMFNCPTNKQKCGWLYRDGVVSYCSKYFYLNDQGKGLVPCGGIPPKMLGKQIVSFLQFSQIFKVLNNNKINHRPAIEVWNIMRPLLKIDMLHACKVLRDIHGNKADFEKKEMLAKQTDVELGGLLEGQATKDTQAYLRSIKYRFSMIMQNYTFDCVGVFLIANILVKEDTELWKCLATVQRSSMKDIIHVMRIISDELGMYDIEELNWCRSNINRMERAIIKGTSMSSSSSTYHRKTPKKDLDIFLDKDLAIDEDYSKYWFSKSDSPAMALSRFIDYFADKSYSDIDNIKRYYRDEYLFKKYKAVSYDGITHSNVYDKYKVWDPTIEKWIRVEESDQDRYNTTMRGSRYSSWGLQSQACAEVQQFIKSFKRFKQSETPKLIYGIYDRILFRKTQHQALTEIEMILRRQTDMSFSDARRAARAILIGIMRHNPSLM